MWQRKTKEKNWIPLQLQCCKHSDKRDKDLAWQSFLCRVIFGIICFLMLVGTVVDMWQYVNPFPPLSMQTNDSLILKVLKSFSIYTNGKIILNTNTGKNHINCLAGIRAITMCWIIYGHTYLRGEELVFTGIIQNRQFLTEVRHT